jgi:hypothetical protein
MATKSSKTNPALSKKKASVNKAPSSGTTGEKPKPSARKKRSAKASPAKVAASVTLDPKPPVQEPVISHDDIALRAYFIGERRQQMGWHGDSASDWSDAVSQLRAEALEKPLKKR